MITHISQPKMQIVKLCKELGEERKLERKEDRQEMREEGGIFSNLIHSFLQLSKQNPRKVKIKLCG